jgi:tetratricopeptide (TPR) repeat protein
LSFSYFVLPLEKEKENNRYGLFGICCCKDALERTSSEEKMAQLYKLLKSFYTDKINFSSNEDERKNIGLEIIRCLELYLHWFIKQPPFPNSEIPYYLKEIADTYKLIQLFEEALINYNKILVIYDQQYDPLCLSLHIDICKEIVEIYIEHKEDYVSALKYQLVTHDLTLKNNVIESDDNIWEIGLKNRRISHSYQKSADIYIKLRQYNLARENLSKARKIYEKTDVREKEEKIADIDEKLG